MSDMVPGTSPEPPPLGPKPEGYDEQTGLFKFFLPRNTPEGRIDRKVLNAYLPYFLGAKAHLDVYDHDDGFYYWAWRSLTPAMVEDIANPNRTLGHNAQPLHPPTTYTSTSTAQTGYPPSSTTDPTYSGAPSYPYPTTTTNPPYPPNPPKPAVPAYIRPEDCVMNPANGKPYFYRRENRYLTPEEVEQVWTIMQYPPPQPQESGPPDGMGVPGGYSTTGQYVSSTSYLGNPVGTHYPGSSQSIPRGGRHSPQDAVDRPPALYPANVPVAPSHSPSTYIPGSVTTTMPDGWNYDDHGRRVYVRDGKILSYAD